MTRLENELRSALSERAVATPSRDLFGAATRRHRRRRVVQGGAASAGALGLAAVLAYGAVGGPTGAPAPTPVVQLSVATLGERMAQAAESRDRSGHIEHRITRAHFGDGTVTTLEVWSLDDGSGTKRAYGRKGPKSPLIDQSREIVDGRLVTVSINHAKRTWNRTTSTLFPAMPATELDCSRAEGYAPDGNRCAFSGEAIRAATQGENPTFQKLGTEAIDGRKVLRLLDARAAEDYPTERHELYVDADTYDIVRTVNTPTSYPGEGVKVVQDYRFLAPTAENREELRAVAPDAYRHTADVVEPDRTAEYAELAKRERERRAG